MKHRRQVGAALALFLAAPASCDNDVDTGSFLLSLPAPKGRLTVTGLEDYNNASIQAVIIIGKGVFGVKAIGMVNGKSVMYPVEITGGKVVIPLYYEEEGEMKAYEGNERGDVALIIFTQSVIMFNDEGKSTTDPIALGAIMNVTLRAGRGRSGGGGPPNCRLPAP